MKKPYCNKCGDCCKGFSKKDGVVVFPSELDRISSYLYINKKDFINLFLKRRKVTIEKRRHTIFLLRFKENKDCIFLTSNNKCKIHNVKPNQCLNWPEKSILNKSKDYPCLTDDHSHDSLEFDSNFFDEILSTASLIN